MPAEALNLKQVARLLGVHYMTAYRHVRHGDLPAWRDGPVWLVDRADAEALAAERLASTGAGRSGTSGQDPRRARSRLARHLALGDEVAAWTELREAGAPGTDAVAVHALVLDALAVATRKGSGAVAAPQARRLVARLGAVALRPGRARGVAVVVGPAAWAAAPPVAGVAANLLRARGLRVVEADLPFGPDEGGAGGGPVILASVGSLDAVPAALADPTSAASHIEVDPSPPGVVGAVEPIVDAVAALEGRRVP